MTGTEEPRRQLSDVAAFSVHGLPEDERRKALRERTPEELERAGLEIRKALTSEKWWDGRGGGD
ncbi:hypothetical protein [Streptomyces luteireticuli]|uniref:Uncharacterized protein n=1 Tax=Streptomyces luteireticuli TaxID=173858 RepID=A0ABN0YER2_9ACTN